MTLVDVISPGALTTIQDLGRPGWAHLGVPRSGAADRPALIRANRLVGNADGAAALETTLSGPRLRARAQVTIALTGAPVRAHAGGELVPMNRAVTLAAGQELRVGNALSGLRTYIAFRGGLDVPAVLGSASTDLLSGLGPPPLRRGDLLSVAAATGSPSTRPDAHEASASTPSQPERPEQPNGPEQPEHPERPDHAEPSLRVVLGPRDDWFAPAAVAALTLQSFRVTPASNRIGLRLEGRALERARDGELRSEGLVAGALQVPPTGLPILMLADHPTTGGYPVIAVVLAEDLPLAAQLRPGQELRLRSVPAPAQASAGSISASRRFLG